MIPLVPPVFGVGFGFGVLRRSTAYLFIGVCLVTGSAQAEECSWETGICFGVNWNTVTVADVKTIDVNAQADGATPLHYAAGFNQNPAVITALLKAGAEVNTRNKDGNTPLHWAASSNQNSAVIAALVKAGAEVNTRDKLGLTPLHWAAWFNQNPAVITALLKAGARARARTEAGQTPFDLIERNERLKDTDAYQRLKDAQHD